LWALATKATTTAEQRDAIVNRIASTPALRQDAARLLPQLQAMIRPATREEAYAAVQPLMLLRKLPDFGTGPEAAALQRNFMQLFLEKLDALPAAALKDGVDEFLRTAKGSYFPSPGEINELAEPYAVKLRMAEYRIKRALQAQAASKPVVTEAERAMIARGMKELPELMARRKVPEAHRPAFGVTPQMMAARLREHAGRDEEGKDYGE
jgi:hypothetical protein